MAREWTPRAFRPVKGWPNRKCGQRQVSICFDPDTLNEISNLAEEKGQSFSETVRQLVEYGLEADSEFNL